MVSVGRGQTAYPKSSKELQNIGLRCDFDGEVEYDGTIYNKFQVQPNAGKIDTTLRQWREKNGGTHAVMGVMYVKKGGSEEDVITGWDNFADGFVGGGSPLEAETSGSVSGAVANTRTETASSSSSEWTWWPTEQIYHRQVGGVDEWSAPKSDADSDRMWSATSRKYCAKYANGTVVWQ